MTKKMIRKPEKKITLHSPEAVWRILGLAVCAGKAITGTQAAEKALRRQSACLVIVAADIAENSGQKILRQCSQAQVPVRQFGSKSDLGHWTGHEERAVAVILDTGLAGRIEELIDALDIQTGADRPQNDISMFGG
jgi:ribosomal protein L7Ae-like RNA K-turn-binding protein